MKVETQTQTHTETPVETESQTPAQNEDEVIENTQVAEKSFTQSDIDRIVGERLAREKEKSEKAILLQQEDAERKRLEEQNEYKSLYEKLMAQNEELKNLSAESERRILRNEVATEIGLPLGLAARLQGDTRDEIVEDAKRMLEMIGSQKMVKPSIQPETSAKSGTVTQDEKRILQEKFGIIWRGE